MAVDTNVVARLVAGAQALVAQSRALIADNKAKDDKIAALTQQLGDEQAAEAAEDVGEAAANEQILAAADAVDALLQSDETPTVDPVPVEDVPAVVSGDTPVTGTDTSGDPLPAAGDSPTV